jgi:hypothetical protein
LRKTTCHVYCFFAFIYKTEGREGEVAGGEGKICLGFGLILDQKQSIIFANKNNSSNMVMNDDLLWITSAEYIDGYRISVTFSNNTRKIVDLKDRLYGEIFLPLNDIEVFKRFFVSDWTVEWENGADFAPEYLYELGTAIPPASA